MPARPTFGLLRNNVAFTKPLGLCAGDITGAAGYTNLCQERLIMDPLAPDEGYWGGSAVMAFSLQVLLGSAYIITPREIGRVTAIDVCRRPIPMRNALWEYLEFGTGLHPRGCGATCQGGCSNTPQAFERDTVPALTPVPQTPYNYRIYFTNPADANRRVVIQGTDQNGMTIYGVDPATLTPTLGETIYMAAPFATSVNKIIPTAFLKDATLGPVQFFWVDGSGNQTLLTTMQPGETTAQYRRYLLDGLPQHCCGTPSGTVQISAFCKLDFVPVQNDQDPLIIQSIPALIEEAQSIRYSRMDSQTAPALEKKHHEKALSILTGQMDHYYGKITPAVRISIGGSQPFRLQPR